MRRVRGVHLDLLCEPGFKSFPSLVIELTSWSRSYFSSDTVLISRYIKRRNKGGALICKYANKISAAALIRVPALNSSFTVCS